MNKTLLNSIKTIGVLVTLAPGSFAALIATDGFETGAGNYNTATLSGQGPAVSGFTGNWGLAGDSSAGTVNTRVISSGLDFGGTGSGGAVESFRTGTGAGGRFMNHRAFSGSPEIEAGSTIYFSALVNFTTGNAAGVGLRFDARRHFGVGFDATGRAGIWRSGTGGANADNGSFEFLNVTTDPYAANTTYMIVGKMDAVAGSSTTDAETISLVGVFAFGDTIADGSLLTADYDVYFSESVLPGNFAGQTLSRASIITSKSADGIAAQVDEIYYGTSFDAVAIPEPSTVALLVGLAGFGAVMMRRRLRK